MKRILILLVLISNLVLGQIRTVTTTGGTTGTYIKFSGTSTASNALAKDSSSIFTLGSTRLLARNFTFVDGNQGATQYMKSDANGVASWASLPAAIASNAWSLNGNTVASEKFIGTLDAFNFPIRVNNGQVATFLYSATASLNGNFGINTTSPTAKLHITGYDSTSSNFGFKVENVSNTALFYVRNDGNIQLGLAGGAIGVGYDVGFVPAKSMVFFGQDIGNNTFSGGLNFAFGYSNFNALTSGSNNIAIGYTNQNSSTTGTANVGVGHTALVNNIDGSYNQAFGNNALNANTSGSSNTAIGYQSMFVNTQGASCVAIGEQTLFSQVNPSGRNVAVGVYAGRLTTGSNGLFLGTWAGRYETAGDALYIDTYDRADISGGKTKSLVYGIFDADPLNQYFTVNGNITANARLRKSQGVDVASAAGAIALGYGGNLFEITGTDAITLISNLGWQNGSEVTLMFTSTATLTNGTATSGTDITILLAGATNFVASANDVITLVLGEIGGTQAWREKSRSVN